MAFEDPNIARIVAFLESIGIACIAEPMEEGTFLPGATVRDGTLVFDPALPHPGDLLHEAGHIAVTDPALRPTLSQVADSPAEEMSAIAWSYAAALAAGIDPLVVFHEHGYKGGGGYLLPCMQSPLPPGLPMLQLFRMTACRKDAEAVGLPVFPEMARWLR
jgi:hypothetical protein